MTEATFDPTGAVRFDLPRGAIRTCQGEEAVLVPVAAIARLAREAPADVTAAFAEALGASIGLRVKDALPEPTLAPVSVFATHFVGALAIAGCGAATFTRWGRALVIAFEAPTLPREVLAKVVGRALETATSRGLDAVAIVHDEVTAKYLIVREATAATVRTWLSDGVSWSDALARLNTRARGTV